MSEHELEQLLGGFAADTLTAEEKQRLYSAALQDQQLFNALADEQALKELLADPAVRRRLLQILNHTSSSGAGGSLSWLDWLRRPAGLAFAGGLAVAVFAVVLGTKVYQDSLKHAAQPVATEEAKPATPPAPAPPQAAEPQPAVKDTLLADKMAKRERSAASVPQEQAASERVRGNLNQQQEQDEVRRRADAPVAALSKASEEVAASADQKLAVSPAPPATGSIPTPMQAPPDAPATGAGVPAISARALYYGGEVARADSGPMTQEKERALHPLAESAPQTNRLERKLDQFAQLGRMKGTVAAARPLGLRYSLVVRGTDGQDREIDAATASKSVGPLRLTVEANQDAYLQVWKTVGSSTPQLLFPDKDSGQISVKIPAGQRQQIPLPADSGSVTLTTRLSRVPFGPITRQEAAMFDRPTPHQLQESVTASGVTGLQERATYVINQDPSPTVQLSVVIPVDSP